MPIVVRPTLRVLRLLPEDSLASTGVLTTLAKAKATSDLAERTRLLGGLRLNELDHPLLDDARRGFVSGRPDIHASSTKAAKRRVYEVRSRSGAAWRGAVILDDDEEIAWLVFAAVHNGFHSSAAAYLASATSSWEPGQLDLELAAADLAHERQKRWKIATLTAILDALSAAVHHPSRHHEITIPVDIKGRSGKVRITGIEHERPASNPSSAHETGAMVSITAGARITQDIVQLLSRVQHDDVPMESVYTEGSLVIVLLLTHARLAQLSQTIHDTGAGGALPDLVVPCQTSLHYVGKNGLVAGLVNGTAVLALCGVWFVLQRDSSSSSPICPMCEETQPLAQRVIDAARG